jgi:YVTN family beta-propeller protein
MSACQDNTIMNTLRSLSRVLFVTTLAMLASRGLAQTPPADAPYKIVNTAQLMGTGRIDYVSADSENRHLYVPRGNAVLVFNLDTLKPETSIPNLMGGHGVAVDPVSGHAFSSSQPILMWDSKTLQTIKTIIPQGRPDGILFEPLTESVYVFSHGPPNATVINAKDGTIVGTIDLGGAPEQSASDGQGHLYVDLEDKNSIAVVDVKTLKVTATYPLGANGGGPGGLGLDAKNHILFAFCHEPAGAVILSAVDGKILATLPTGNGTDGGGFNPATMEAFSSQRDGTLTIIKENSPTSFAVEQTVQTLPGAKTCTLDTQTNHIVLIATDRPAPPPGGTPGAPGTTPPGAPAPATASATPSPAPAAPPTPPAPAPATVAQMGTNAPPGGPGGPGGEGRPGGPGGQGGPGGFGGRRGGFGGGPAMLHILVVGR